MDDVSRITPSELRHRHADLLVVILKVNAHILLQLLAPTQGGVDGVFVEHTTVEKVLLRELLLVQQMTASTESQLCPDCVHIRNT